MSCSEGLSLGNPDGFLLGNCDGCKVGDQLGEEDSIIEGGPLSFSEGLTNSVVLGIEDGLVLVLRLELLVGFELAEGAKVT